MKNKVAYKANDSLSGIRTHIHTQAQILFTAATALPLGDKASWAENYG